METKTPSTRNPAVTRQRLVVAAVNLILRQGFNATSLDQICAEAKVTKGSFFHHFQNKEEIGHAVIRWWSDMGTSLYAEAWKDLNADPLSQLHAMIDIMISFTQNPEEPCVCAIGMMAQELGASHPMVRDGCARELNLWTQNTARLVAAAKEQHHPAFDFDPEQIAWFLNSLWQGSMLVGKTMQSPDLIRKNLHLAHGYVDSLFLNPPKDMSQKA